MANTLSKPTSTIPDKAAALRSQIEFVQWGIPFLAYLVKEKGPTNPALLGPCNPKICNNTRESSSNRRQLLKGFFKETFIAYFFHNRLNRCRRSCPINL